MKLPPLHAKQLPTLQRAAAFGVTTLAAEMLACHYSLPVAAGLLGRRVADHYLETIPLRYDLTGFRLTRAACHAHGWPPDLVRPLGSLQAALPRLAALYDSCRRQVLPLAVTRGHPSDLRSTDYRLVPGDTRPVALLHLDAGGNPVRVRKRVKALLLAAKADPALGRLLANDEFAVRVLTPTFDKAEFLLRAFRVAPPPGPVEVMPVPEITKWLLTL